MNIATVRPNRFAGDGEPKAQARAVLTAPFSEGLATDCRVVLDAAALVFNGDGHHVANLPCRQGHGALGARILERVVEEVSDRRREELHIDANHHGRVHCLRVELQPPILGVQRGGRDDVGEEGHQ